MTCHAPTSARFFTIKMGKTTLFTGFQRTQTGGSPPVGRKGLPIFDAKYRLFAPLLHVSCSETAWGGVGVGIKILTRKNLIVPPIPHGIR
jgi:hypothetical protein